jgi:misacylated tRNA(Ala) deacylase
MHPAPTKGKMMTEMLYQTDAFLREFDAQVTAVDEANHAAALERTAFYPGGGGQPADKGVLEMDDTRLTLLRAKKDAEGLIWHYWQEEGMLLKVGDRVHGVVDWARRHALMRTHTALHILCGVVYRDYGALVTGGDMDELHGRMDFEFETLSKDLVGVIEEAVNREVSAARPVRVAILPREEAFQIPDLIRTKINLLPAGISHVRTVELVGLDLQADGGTHVANTAEVGRIRVTDYKSKGKINKRIYIELE